MGFFKSLFSSEPVAGNENSGQTETEKKRIAFETLRDNGVRALNMKEYKMASAYFEKALELNAADSDACALLAEAYLRGGDMENALKLLRPMAASSPDNINVWISIAQAALQLKQFDEALDAASHAVDIDKGNPSAHYFAAMAYEGMEKHAEAVAKFTDAISLADDYDAAYTMRAQANLAQSRCDEAEGDADRLIAGGSNDDFVYVMKGDLRRHAGDAPAAVQAYARAIALNPFNSDAYAGQAAAYAETGDFGKAMEVFEGAFEYMPQSTSLFRARAAVREKNGDSEGAAADLAKAGAIAPPEDGNSADNQFVQLQNRVEDAARKANPFGL